MPIERPTLDDRTYPDLVQEGVALIPRYAPEWTNHNASDPGITLLELFAYLAEVYVYRVGRVSHAAHGEFLRLLGGEVVPENPEARVAQLRRTVSAMRRPSRAVSVRDYEVLALAATREPAQPGHAPGSRSFAPGNSADAVSRVYCFPRRDLEARTAADRRRDRPNHVSVVFVPSDLAASAAVVEAIAQRIRAYLQTRRLLTTRLHVVAPRFVDTTVRVHASVASAESAVAVEGLIRKAVEGLLAPQSGGWPIGRSLYVAELYQLLSQVHGVSALEAVTIDAAQASLLTSEDGDVVGVRADADELLRLRPVDVVIQS